MKNLDFFRTPKSSSTKSTVYGGIISLVSLFILVLVIIYQIVNFEEKTVINQVTVENDGVYDNLAIMEMNLTIYDVSCLIINPMITSEIDSSINSIDQVFRKTRIYKENGVVKYDTEDKFEEEIEKTENEEEVMELIKENFKENES